MVKFDNLQDAGFKRVAFGIISLIDDGLEARQNEQLKARVQEKCDLNLAFSQTLYKIRSNAQ